MAGVLVESPRGIPRTAELKRRERTTAVEKLLEGIAKKIEGC